MSLSQTVLTAMTISMIAVAAGVYIGVKIHAFLTKDA